MSKPLLDARSLQGPSARRGIGRYARGLLRALAEAGLDYDVLIDGGLPDPAVPNGVKLYATRRRYRGRLAGYEDSVALVADLRKIRPSLYHALHLTLPGRAPCPVVVTVHDLIPWAFGGWRMAGERLRYRTARRLLPRADLLLAVSQATAADIRRLVGAQAERVRVVYEGLDPAFRPREGAPDRVRRRWSVSKPYLVFVGALDVRKDPAGLLRAWGAARASGADLDLLVAGESGRQAPSNMGGARLLGYVDDESLADLLSAAGCLVFPSLYEGFGLPALEAMGCGCPVAAYRNSSLPEIVGDAGALVANRDSEALGRAAAALLAEPQRSQARNSGLSRARSFSWEKAARETMAAYRDLTGSSAG